MALWWSCGSAIVDLCLKSKGRDSIGVDNALNLITTSYQSLTVVTTSSACTSCTQAFRQKKNTLNRFNEMISEVRCKIQTAG